MTENKNKSTIFFGTHDFAITILESLLNDPNISVDLVVTQPDKPVGRKKELHSPPVKIFAEKHGLKVDQPSSLKNYSLPSTPHSLNIVAQYGKLIPKHIIDTPKHGTLNVHTSLLPKYRGASPIQSAIINGESETGITIMKMDEGLDTGPIILQKSLKIEPNDTYATVDQKLAKLGSEALLEAIPGYIDGSLTPQAQDDGQATECKQLSRDDGKVDWNKSAEKIYNQYRGLTPWPGIWTTWNGKRLKLVEVKLKDKDGVTNVSLLKPGEVSVENDKINISTINGSIEVKRLQLEGKKEMIASDFLKGHTTFDNAILN